ncbi:MAG: enoyl-CoA hydratase [Spirochaetes bacterium]|nr:enoyl-CoA hydratase/isomerase family protein [Deltaproteobacteria bacterium]RKY01322.1 MAG: enoyl-CoA hydratase [Spirochaetota bacterium]
MDFKFILFEKKDGVARITINRPPYNVLDIPTMKEINFALEDIKSDQQRIKLIVITNAGSKAFSAGVDVADHTEDKVDEMIEVFHRMFRNLDSMDIPSLAIVNGVALGGGMELAVFCDMVIASEKSKFGQPEIKVGVYPSMVVAWLSKIIGLKKAYEMILSGDTISAKEAEQIGLINMAVPDAELEEKSEEFIKKITNNSAVVLKWAKKAVKSGLNVDFETGLKNSEVIYKYALMATYDAKEGIDAFINKREPVWKDK